jgi:hypothetical protein
MYSWNAFTTILEKISGAFFNPKGITLYAKEPNSEKRLFFLDLPQQWVLGYTPKIHW